MQRKIKQTRLNIGLHLDSVFEPWREHKSSLCEGDLNSELLNVGVVESGTRVLKTDRLPEALFPSLTVGNKRLFV